ncbi:MAG: prenyltransferase [Candidatus Microsaccharimonas sp.]
MKFFETIRKLFWVSRPISWPNTSYPFAAGFLVVTAGIVTNSEILTLIIGTFYFLGPYNLLLYGVNDVYDYESDIRNPRKGGVEGMREARAFHPTILKAVVLTNAPFLLYLFAVSSWEARAVLAVVVFGAVAYSLKGLRFKEIPFLDSITSSFHFVGPLVFALSLTAFPATAWPWITAFFLWGMASHAFGAVQDIIPDRKGELKSVATVLGARKTVWFAILSYGAASFITILQGWPYWLIAIAGLAYVINCLPYLAVTDKTSGKTNKGWKRFLWLNYGAGALITILVIFATISHT